jgi:hypothetical protein
MSLAGCAQTLKQEVKARLGSDTCLVLFYLKSSGGKQRRRP